MAGPESKFVQAERHVREGAERVKRQAALAEQLERDGHRKAAEAAWGPLSALEESLQIAREHLRIQREEAGLKP